MVKPEKKQETVGKTAHQEPVKKVGIFGRIKDLLGSSKEREVLERYLANGSQDLSEAANDELEIMGPPKPVGLNERPESKKSPEEVRQDAHQKYGELHVGRDKNEHLPDQRLEILSEQIEAADKEPKGKRFVQLDKEMMANEFPDVPVAIREQYNVVPWEVAEEFYGMLEAMQRDIQSDAHAKGYYEFMAEEITAKTAVKAQSEEIAATPDLKEEAAEPTPEVRDETSQTQEPLSTDFNAEEVAKTVPQIEVSGEDLKNKSAQIFQQIKSDNPALFEGINKNPVGATYKDNIKSDDIEQAIQAGLAELVQEGVDVGKLLSDVGKSKVSKEELHAKIQGLVTSLKSRHDKGQQQPAKEESVVAEKEPVAEQQETVLVETKSNMPKGKLRFEDEDVPSKQGQESHTISEDEVNRRYAQSFDTVVEQDKPQPEPVMEEEMPLDEVDQELAELLAIAEEKRLAAEQQEEMVEEKEGGKPASQDALEALKKRFEKGGLDEGDERDR